MVVFQHQSLSTSLHKAPQLPATTGPQSHLVKMGGPFCQSTDVTEVCEGVKLRAHNTRSLSPSFLTLAHT